MSGKSWPFLWNNPVATKFEGKDEPGGYFLPSDQTVPLKPRTTEAPAPPCPSVNIY